MSCDNCGQSLLLGNAILEAYNGGYTVVDAETGGELLQINVQQNEAGNDTENRIELMKAYFEKHLAKLP